MVEMITVVAFVALLASIAGLRYIDLTREGFTSQVAGDIAVARTAVLSYYGDSEQWPATSDLGQPPAGLAPYLPGGGIFNRPRWRMAWINIPTAPNPTLGIMVQSDDPAMMAKLVQRFGNRAPFVVAGGTITYIMSTPESGF